MLRLGFFESFWAGFLCVLASASEPAPDERSISQLGLLHFKIITPI